MTTRTLLRALLAVHLLLAAVTCRMAHADPTELIVLASQLLDAAEIAGLIAHAPKDEAAAPLIKQVPAPKVAYDRGEGCAPGEAIRLLSEGAYRASVNQAGLAIGPEDRALPTVTEYHGRNAYARDFLGMRPGAGILRGNVAYGGQTWHVGNLAIRRHSGIHYITRHVSAEAFKSLLMELSQRAAGQASIEPARGAE